MFELLYKGPDYVQLRIAGQVHKVKTLDLLQFTKALSDITKLPDGPRGQRINLPATPPINLRKV
jgi:hypothetical protein